MLVNVNDLTRPQLIARVVQLGLVRTVTDALEKTNQELRDLIRPYHQTEVPNAT